MVQPVTDLIEDWSAHTEGKTKMANSKNAAKSAVNAAKAKADATKADAPKQEGEQTYAEKRKAVVATAQALVGKQVKVIGGRKHKDCKAIIGWGGANKYLAPIVRAKVEGVAEIQFFDAKHLEVLGDAPAKDAKAVADQIKSEADATLYIAATVTQESDKAVCIAYPGWFKRIWFTKEMVTNTGATMNDDAKTAIYEIPEWKVRSEVGQDSVDALKAKQTALEAIVNG